MANPELSPPTDANLLRDVTPADLPIFYEHQRDPVAVQMAAFPSRDRDAFMAHWAKILADETVIVQTILYDEQVAGNLVSFVQSGEREVGYWIGREFWGRGIATRALAHFLEGFPDRPRYAHVAKNNPASRRVLEKCGFTVCAEDLGAPDAAGNPVEEFVLVLTGETPLTCAA
jgi:RimJ/RimL family protein N-acetyltransferase